MKILVITAIYSVTLMSSGCSTTPDYQRITTEEEYLASVVGRSVHLGESASTITHSDGTMTGKAGDREITGTWSWEDEHFCREGKIGEEDLTRDCQKMEIAGDQLRITRDDGSIRLLILK